MQSSNGLILMAAFYNHQGPHPRFKADSLGSSHIGSMDQQNKNLRRYRHVQTSDTYIWTTLTASRRVSLRVRARASKRARVRARACVCVCKERERDRAPWSCRAPLSRDVAAAGRRGVHQLHGHEPRRGDGGHARHLCCRPPHRRHPRIRRPPSAASGTAQDHTAIRQRSAHHTVRVNGGALGIGEEQDSPSPQIAVWEVKGRDTAQPPPPKGLFFGRKSLS